MEFVSLIFFKGFLIPPLKCSTICFVCFAFEAAPNRANSVLSIIRNCRFWFILSKWIHDLCRVYLANPSYRGQRPQILVFVCVLLALGESHASAHFVYAAAAINRLSVSFVSLLRQRVNLLLFDAKQSKAPDGHCGTHRDCLLWLFLSISFFTFPNPSYMGGRSRFFVFVVCFLNWILVHVVHALLKNRTQTYSKNSKMQTLNHPKSSERGVWGSQLTLFAVMLSRRGVPERPGTLFERPRVPFWGLVWW